MKSLILIYYTFSFFQFVSSFNGENIFIQTANAGNIGGKIQEINGKGCSVFQGIPYAKPPVGNLRFRDPEPLDPKPASSAVDASKGFSKMCVQGYGYSATNQSEDCLYLNVLSPKTQTSDDTKYPVMVWIHGGGFVIGSASEYPVEGSLRNIVSRGVVFVSINYRLGTFGFLTTRSSTAAGNYGLLDQVESLRWVQNNIQYFGGDPAKVTIFGESAGGASVSFLTITPLAKGLFNQAILMSGSALAPWAMMYDSDPDDYSGTILTSLGCRRNPTKPAKSTCPYRTFVGGVMTPEILKQHEEEMSCLRSKSVDEIATKTASFGMRPRVDGKYFPEAPELLLKKRNPYNLMMGVDKDEVATLSKNCPHFIDFPGISSGITQTESQFNRSSVLIDCKTFKFPSLANFTANYYYGHSTTPAATGLDEKHFWFQQSVKRDSALMFWIPAYQDTLAALGTNSKVYLYSWEWQNAGDYYDSTTDFYWKGAGHGSELFLVFDNETIGMFQQDGPHTRRDKSQDCKWVDVWGKLLTNFAKSGNPTPDDSIDGVIWEPFSTKDENYLVIDMPKIHMANKFYEHDVGVYTKFLPALEQSVKCGERK